MKSQIYIDFKGKTYCYEDVEVGLMLHRFELLASVEKLLIVFSMLVIISARAAS